MEPDPSTVAQGETSEGEVEKEDPRVSDLKLKPPRSAVQQYKYWAAGALALTLAIVAVAGMLYKTPYVALTPGSVRDTEPLLEVEGLTTFPSEGTVYFTTVHVRQEPNYWEYLWLKSQKDNEILPQEAILGDRTPEENREVNLDMMADSKEVAVAVALEHLGYEAIETNGALVSKLADNSPAEGVLEAGDVIIAVDDKPVAGVDDLVGTLDGYEPGQAISVTYERYEDLSVETGEVVLGDHPDRPGAAFIGIWPVERFDFTEHPEFEIDIDSGAVGGPSAGLAFTLAVLDDLTPGELTGGDEIAVTGTINVAGEVGPVGGVVQKTAAVRDRGVKVFIVPAALGDTVIEKIHQTAGDNLQVIPVNTLDEALDALAELGGDVEAISEYAQPTG